MSLYKYFIICIVVILTISCRETDRIDRKSLVERHTVMNSGFDTLGSLTVGNGGFAFTVDFTGLQTFVPEYSRGIPLGTQSDWGWHSFPNDNWYEISETMELYQVNGREVSYSVHREEPQRSREAVEYFRTNPHRLHLGTIGFILPDDTGMKLIPEDIESLKQELNPWDGEIKTSFKLYGETVEVITVCHPELDMISFRVESELLRKNNLQVGIHFPYPTGQHTDMGCRWDVPDMHESQIVSEREDGVLIARTLDASRYFTSVAWTEGTDIIQEGPHQFILLSETSRMEVSVQFNGENKGHSLPGFAETRQLNRESWKEFWLSGGAVDFTGSTDPRAHELERRIILSQYLTRIQCAGDHPPQETGLTYNSWHGKFHLEMAWWHMAHFFFWGRSGLMTGSMDWYESAAENARKTAERQGYQGLRWQKMTEPGGEDSPSSVGSFLIWQQPHYIYFAELCYSQTPTIDVLEKYKDLVFASADFMSDFPVFDSIEQRYELGPPVIPAQECFDPVTTTNPPFELSYWHWGLNTAITWAERLGIDPDPHWSEVLDKLSMLYSENGLYIPAESVPNAYKEGTHMYDHPAVLGAFGMLPPNPLLDTSIMAATFDYVWDHWQWERTWGWDFPLTAMTAARLGKPDKAIEALFIPVKTNTYLGNGHNYQTERLRLYLPGNGGLLTAVAMMCAGYEGCTTSNPGIPSDGTWTVRWEGIRPLP
jgi:hypothetical protein